jgi:hypothetical protein
MPPKRSTSRSPSPTSGMLKMLNSQFPQSMSPEPSLDSLRMESVQVNEIINHNNNKHVEYSYPAIVWEINKRFGDMMPQREIMRMLSRMGHRVVDDKLTKPLTHVGMEFIIETLSAKREKVHTYENFAYMQLFLLWFFLFLFFFFCV